VRVEGRPKPQAATVGQDDLDATGRGLLGLLGNDVHWEECRFLVVGLVKLSAPS
jgi:hypothetical protein